MPKWKIFSSGSLPHPPNGLFASKKLRPSRSPAYVESSFESHPTTCPTAREQRRSTRGGPVASGLWDGRRPRSCFFYRCQAPVGTSLIRAMISPVGRSDPTLGVRSWVHHRQRRRAHHRVPDGRGGDAGHRHVLIDSGVRSDPASGLPAGSSFTGALRATAVLQGRPSSLPGPFGPAAWRRQRRAVRGG